MSEIETSWVVDRNKALVRAGEGIIEANKHLKQLELILKDTALGKYPDLLKVVDIVHVLRGHVDAVLIGLVESSALRPKDDRK